jgi:NAD(P)-dependent dehydrogenase (short-subunit alcohol dehydrogenase family)
MDFGLADKVAIVTGSSRGIGRACAESLLGEGATVVVTGRDAARLEKTVADMRTEFSKVLGVQIDLGSDAQAKALVDRTMAEFGRVDILVNAAATVTPSDFFALGEEGWLGIFEEKLNGYARMLRHVVPIMRERKWGRVVNISGVAARQAHAQTVTVGVNNAAVLNLTKALAGAVAKDGVTVNAIIPHIIHTDRQDETMSGWAKLTGQKEEDVRRERVSRIPIGRMGQPREVGDAVAFLASERASFITGAALHVDGGVTMAI